MFELFQWIQLSAVDPPLSPPLLAAALFVLTFVSEDAACVAAGTLAAQGRIGLAAALIACFAGIVAGDVALYGVGRLFGRSMIENRVVTRFVSPDSISRASAWLDRRGASVVFVSRFVTGLRLPTYLAAGIFSTGFQRFLFYFTLAALAWTPIAVGLAYTSSSLFADNLLVAVAAAALCLGVGARMLSHRGRRLMVGRIRRIVKWEFWPVQLFYLPVICYVLCLAVKHRSLAVFTCANPAITAGGLIGEAKSSIYAIIERSAAAESYILRYKKIDAVDGKSERISQVINFIDANRLSYPVVLKPDIGERGKGVMIARTPKEAADYASHSDSDIIVQEYVGGVEASIFYHRYPSDPTGKIFSITEKRFPAVIGDGESDLRSLILNDARAVVFAKSYFDQNKTRLDEVPAKGENVTLIDIGTHSRGAVFADGKWLRTEKLELAVDEMCRGIEGFYFGRFDLKAESFDDFKNGGPFKIIELNGVSSESTNIYDPRFSLFDAYAILFRQWRVAFEIGAENRRRGFRPTEIAELLELIFRIGKRPAQPKSLSQS